MNHSMDSESPDETVSCTEDEINRAINEYVVRNEELNHEVAYLKNEIIYYDKKHEDLQQRLNTVLKLLEQNANMYQELLVDAQSALQIGTVCMFGVPHKSSPENNVLRPQQQTLIACVNRANHKNNKLSHVQKASVRDRDVVQAEQQETSNISTQLESRLSTIQEETLHESIINKQVSVRLTRLSKDVLLRHLRQQNSTTNLQSLDSHTNDDFSLSQTNEMEPNDASTPLKLELMNSLHLLPRTSASDSSGDGNYVTTRRGKMREKTEEHQKNDCENNSPVQSRIENLTNSPKRVNSPDSPKQKPKRRAARCGSLKEKSLRTKLRRT